MAFSLVDLQEAGLKAWHVTLSGEERVARSFCTFSLESGRSFCPYSLPLNGLAYVTKKDLLYSFELV